MNDSCDGMQGIFIKETEVVFVEKASNLQAFIFTLMRTEARRDEMYFPMFDCIISRKRCCYPMFVWSMRAGVA